MRLHRLLTALLAFACLASAQTAEAQGSATCHGHFPNPITDICWDCFFPLSIGGFDLWPGDKPDPANPEIPVCLCGIRPGLSFGFWEPVRLVDVPRAHREHSQPPARRRAPKTVCAPLGGRHGPQYRSGAGGVR